MYQTIVDDITFTLLLICFLAAIFFTWFFIHRAREKERLLLIEKGVDFSNLPQKVRFKFNFPWLKVGIVVTCTSLGLLTGLLLIGTGLDLDKNGFVPAIIFLFGGVGMIIAHYVDKPTEKM